MESRSDAAFFLFCRVQVDLPPAIKYSFTSTFRYLSMKPSHGCAYSILEEFDSQGFMRFDEAKQSSLVGPRPDRAMLSPSRVLLLESQWYHRRLSRGTCLGRYSEKCFRGDFPRATAEAHQIVRLNREKGL